MIIVRLILSVILRILKMIERPPVTLQLEGLERAWMARAIEVLRGVLVRSRAKEMPGSEIYELRTKEINALEELALKVGRA